MSVARTALWRAFSTPACVGLPVVLLLPLAADYYSLTLLAIYALLALSLGLIWGFGGILCFGQSAFFGIGAYAFAIAVINFESPWAALFLAVATSTAVAALLGAAMFYARLNDVYLAVVTLVFTLILAKFMNSTAGPEYRIGSAPLGGFNGIPEFDTLTIPWRTSSYLLDDTFYGFCAGLLLIAWGFCRWLMTTAFGRVIVAIREHERRVEFLGYDPRFLKSMLFAIGGGLAGLAGVLFANWAEIVTPAMFSLIQSAEIIIWVVFGGLGSFAGPMAGAAILTWARTLLGQQTLIDNYLILGIILIVAVLGFPGGLARVISGIRLPGRARVSGRRTRRRRGVNGSGRAGNPSDAG